MCACVHTHTCKKIVQKSSYIRPCASHTGGNVTGAWFAGLFWVAMEWGAGWHFGGDQALCFPGLPHLFPSFPLQRRLSVLVGNCCSLVCTCAVLMLMWPLLSLLKQTNGYDGDYCGSQSLSRRSGRVSTATVHGTCSQGCCFNVSKMDC